MAAKDYTVDDVFEKASTGGCLWAKFENPGDRVGGEIVALDYKQARDYDDPTQLAEYPSGDPVMEVIAQVLTSQRRDDVEDDDGRRAFHMVVRKDQFNATAEALKEAGAKKLEIGGKLFLTRGKDIAGENKAGKKYKKYSYTAEYTTPAAGAFEDATDDATDDSKAGDTKAGSYTPAQVEALEAAGLSSAQISEAQADGQTVKQALAMFKAGLL